MNASTSAGITEALKWLLPMLFSLSQKYENGDTLLLNPVHAQSGLGSGCTRLGVAGADRKGGGAAKAGWSQTVKIIELDHQVHRSLDQTLYTLGSHGRFLSRGGRVRSQHRENSWPH